MLEACVNWMKDKLNSLKQKWSTDRDTKVGLREVVDAKNGMSDLVGVCVEILWICMIALDKMSVSCR